MNMSSNFAAYWPCNLQIVWLLLVLMLHRMGLGIQRPICTSVVREWIFLFLHFLSKHRRNLVVWLVTHFYLWASLRNNSFGKSEKENFFVQKDLRFIYLPWSNSHSSESASQLQTSFLSTQLPVTPQEHMLLVGLALPQYPILLPWRDTHQPVPVFETHFYLYGLVSIFTDLQSPHRLSEASNRSNRILWAAHKQVTSRSVSIFAPWRHPCSQCFGWGTLVFHNQSPLCSAKNISCNLDIN